MAEEWLVAQGTGEGTRDGRPRDAKRLRRAAHRMCAAISHELMLAHQDVMLGREQRAAEAETWLSLGDNGNGTYTGRFVIPELHGQLLQRHLDTARPHPDACPAARDGEQVSDPTLPGTGPGLSRTEHLGLAFTELLEHLPTDGHAANGTTLLITLDLDTLQTGLGAARLETGDHLSAGEARRLACNAGLVPAVLDTASAPLDLGRETRLHTKAQRQALSLTHDSCAVTGCQRPFAWTEIHHPHPWSQGGTHRPRQRPPPVLLPPPPRPRHPLRPPQDPRRRLALPPTQISRPERHPSTARESLDPDDRAQASVRRPACEGELVLRRGGGHGRPSQRRRGARAPPARGSPPARSAGPPAGRRTRPAAG